MRSSEQNHLATYTLTKFTMLITVHEKQDFSLSVSLNSVKPAVLSLNLSIIKLRKLCQ